MRGTRNRRIVVAANGRYKVQTRPRGHKTRDTVRNQNPEAAKREILGIKES